MFVGAIVFFGSFLYSFLPNNLGSSLVPSQEPGLDVGLLLSGNITLSQEQHGSDFEGEARSPVSR